MSKERVGLFKNIIDTVVTGRRVGQVVSLTRGGEKMWKVTQVVAGPLGSTIEYTHTQTGEVKIEPQDYL